MFISDSWILLGISSKIESQRAAFWSFFRWSWSGFGLNMTFDVAFRGGRNNCSYNMIIIMLIITSVPPKQVSRFGGNPNLKHTFLLELQINMFLELPLLLMSGLSVKWMWRAWTTITQRRTEMRAADIHTYAYSPQTFIQSDYLPCLAFSLFLSFAICIGISQWHQSQQPSSISIFLFSTVYM